MESSIIFWFFIGGILLTTIVISFRQKWNALKRKNTVIKLDHEDVTLTNSDDEKV